MSALLVTLLVLPAGAADVSGTVTLSFFKDFMVEDSLNSYIDTVDISFPRLADSSLVYSEGPYSDDDKPYTVSKLYRLNIPPSVGLDVSGSIGIYFSFYAQSSKSDYELTYASSNVLINEDAFIAGVLDPSKWVFSYYDVNGVIMPFGSSSDVSVSSFSPYGSHADISIGPGFNVSSHSVISPGASGFSVDNLSTYFYVATYNPIVGVKYYIPSFSIVATETSSDLVALEGIADGITQTNSILSANFADIMSLLNSLYNRLGDMQEVQELANTYLSSMASLLSSINSNTSNIYSLISAYLHYLQTIAETADDIYSELQSFHTDFISKLKLLIDTVSAESDDIQAKMEEIYDQLIAWLNSTFAGAVSDGFEDANTDLNQGIQNNDVIEQSWTGSLSDSWAEMNLDTYSFDSSFTSGFLWLSSWFTNIYNAFGLYGSIIILPLIVGICKLLLGMFRWSASRSARGGDDQNA